MQKANIDAKNPILGEVRFVSILLPEEWQIRPAGYIDVELVRETGGDRWVASGYITLNIIRGEKPLAVKITVREPILGFNLDRWVAKASRNSVRSGFVKINGHNAGYSIKKAGRRKYLLLGDMIRWTKIEVAFMCKETARRIDIVAEGDMSVEEAENFIGILSNLRCH